MQYSLVTRGSPPMLPTSHLAIPGAPKIHEKRICNFRCAPGRHKGAQVAPRGGQRAQKCAQGLQNDAKMEVRGSPEGCPNGGPARKGAICDPRSICYVLTTFTGPAKLTFGVTFASKSHAKPGPDRRSTQIHSKVTPLTAKWRRGGPHGVPRAPQASQNDSRNPPKTTSK